MDLRPQLGEFRPVGGVELSDNGPRQLYMAPGFAHRFCVLSEFADLHYKVSRFYDREDEGGLIWNDRDVGIRWPSQMRSSRRATRPIGVCSTLTGLICHILARRHEHGRDHGRSRLYARALAIRWRRENILRLRLARYYWADPQSDRGHNRTCTSGFI